jgi:hypothetical protein
MNAPLVEFHHLRVMRLAAAHDRRAGLRHQAEISHLLRAGARVVTLVPLKRGDDHITLRFQLRDLLREILKITGRGAGAKVARGGEAVHIGLIATHERDLVAVDFKQGRLERIVQVSAAAEIRKIMLAVNIDGFQHPLRAAIGKVIAGQLHHVRADIGEQVDVFRVTAKDQRAGRVGLGEFASREERNFVADVGDVRFAQNIADLFAGVRHAFVFHRHGGGAHEGGDAGEDDGC